MATRSYRELVIEYVSQLPILDDRYLDIRPITPAGGDGHFSVVFRATDARSRQSVILKFFDPQHDSNHRRKEYFRREAEALVDLQDRRRVRHLVEITQGHTPHSALLPAAPGVTLPHELGYY